MSDQVLGSPEVLDPVAAVRRFNRFYTRAIGVLEKGYLGTPYTVAEGRVLYEIAKADGITAKAVAAITGLDAGYLSRIVARLERDGVVDRERSASDGRSTVLRLTARGAEVFSPFDRRSAALVEGLIGGLSPERRARLTGAMAELEELLSAPAAGPVVLRPPRAGDMGWIIERHAVLYAREYGWNGHIEAVTARICADFLDEAPGVARLRLLMVEPSGRGLGIGKRLVAECVAFARAAGYREIVLWTHAVLIAARAIYAAEGFQLEETWTHDDFGAPEVSETWRVML
jgi:DNA-binding MarR family transcriptional regulator